MEINRKKLRKLILREMAGNMMVPQHIAQKAQQIGNGYIIDVSAMEGSGGGYYPGYAVQNGMAYLDQAHISTFEEYIYLLGDYGDGNVHIYPNQSEYNRDF